MSTEADQTSSAVATREPRAMGLGVVRALANLRTALRRIATAVTARAVNAVIRDAASVVGAVVAVAFSLLAFALLFWALPAYLF